MNHEWHMILFWFLWLSLALGAGAAFGLFDWVRRLWLQARRVPAPAYRRAGPPPGGRFEAPPPPRREGWPAPPVVTRPDPPPRRT
jgi:hypothetical protein